MNETIIIILVALLFAAIGFFIGKYIQKLQQDSGQGGLEEQIIQLEVQLANQKELAESSIKNQREQSNQQFQLQQEQINRLEEERKSLSIKHTELSSILAKKEADLANLQLRNEEQKEEVNQLQEKFTKEFENLANKILDEKSNKFTEQNKENLKNILNPLQEKIQTFEKKVEDSQKESISMHSALKEQLSGLKELNVQMSKEALNLTKALKGDNKTQGNWGELVLERVLEKSGLEKDREYFVQQSFTTEEGNRVLPDVVIHLPDNKKMIIDSKVSLTHYERYVNEEDETLQAQFLKEHVSSIKKHVEQLGDKNYHDLYKMESPDFVLLFIPIEPAFAIALNEDNSLYNKAFEKNIVIVTPATLLATLRTIDTMWNNEKQQRNAIEIARQAGALYDKFHNLMTDLTAVGKDMDRAKGNYAAAMNKLFEGRGNLITSVEKIKKLGAKAKKALPDNLLERANEED
ncbi:DNA recombination protein RmuC [Pseudofulvibacter geojedonensis]|uniref:DNA recombination protein RmuC n=1 Tax=Pseudofulvibacter geojedonensis TaxID=1123758 RepID=A0ABW3I085_9FLAO